MQRMKTIKRACAIGVLLLGTNALAQADHDDGHEHEPAPQAQEQAQPSDGIINTTCPVTTDEEVDPAFTIEYKGQTVGFCCRKCRTRFDEDPEAYLAELPMLQTVSMSTQDSDHDEGEAHEHDEGPAGDHDDGASGDHDEAAGAEHDDGEEHDHATGHGQEKTGLAKLIPWLGKFHPPTTHIPIGMLIGAALAEGLYILTKRDLFRNAGTFCVVLAGFGALAAVTLGWFNGGFTLTDDQWTQTVHRWLGTSTALLTVLTVALLIRTSKAGAKPSSRFAYRVSLFVSAGMVGATGFFGGVIVYGLNHYAW
jgi:uncharacterized membrane protein/YHS domain-containing protein